MELLTDVSPGDWLLERRRERAGAGGPAGAGFEAYARILHPVQAIRWDRSVTDQHGMPGLLEETRWPWARVAERQGLTMHPLVQWNRLADVHQGVVFPDGWQVGQTDEGYLDLDLLAALTEHLSATTSTPDELVAGFWNGWAELTGAGGSRYVRHESGLRARLAARLGQGVPIGPLVLPDPEVRAAASRGPFLRWPDVELLLFATSVGELADPAWVERACLGVEPGARGLGPQVIWPRDHAWLVTSDIDEDSTIVAGPRALLDAVLADDRLEAFEVDEDADLASEGDRVNPPRDGWSEGP